MYEHLSKLKESHFHMIDTGDYLLIKCAAVSTNIPIKEEGMTTDNKFKFIRIGYHKANQMRFQYVFFCDKLYNNDDFKILKEKRNLNHKKNIIALINKDENLLKHKN